MRALYSAELIFSFANFSLTTHDTLYEFGQNKVKNSWDIADIEFVVVVGGGGVKSFSCQKILLFPTWNQ